MPEEHNTGSIPIEVKQALLPETPGIPRSAISLGVLSVMGLGNETLTEDKNSPDYLICKNHYEIVLKPILSILRTSLKEAELIRIKMKGLGVGDDAISTAWFWGTIEALIAEEENTPIELFIQSPERRDLLSSLASPQVTIVDQPVFNPHVQKALFIGLESFFNEEATVTQTNHNGQQITYLSGITIPALRWYNNISPGRQEKYANLISDIFSFPKGIIDPKKVQPFIPLYSNAEEIHTGFVDHFNIDTQRPYITICIEASAMEKRWSLDNYAQVSSMLHKKYPKHQFLIVYNEEKPTDGYKPENIDNAFTPYGLRGHYKIIHGSLKTLAVVAQRSTLALSNDTGFAHISAAIEGGPSVILPSSVYDNNMWMWGNRLNEVNSPDENSKDINSITPDTIFDKAKALVKI